MSEERCPDCGAAVGGGDACQRLSEELGLRSYTDSRYARMHRLVVDAYALQHPDRYCRSAKSLVAHLTGAFVALERADTLQLNAAVQAWLSRNPPIERPEPPQWRGERTVADVVGAADPEEHARRVRSWAASVWEAYVEHHDLARRWVDGAAGRAAVKVR